MRESALHAQTARTDASAYNPFGYNFEIQNGQVVATTPYTSDLCPAGTEFGCLG